jgi:hypothetical protein
MAAVASLDPCLEWRLVRHGQPVLARAMLANVGKAEAFDEEIEGEVAL